MSDSKKSNLEKQPILDVSKAPMPEKMVLKARQNPFRQFLRFMDFNFRILGMVFKGHKPHREI